MKLIYPYFYTNYNLLHIQLHNFRYAQLLVVTAFSLCSKSVILNKLLI